MRQVLAALAFMAVAFAGASGAAADDKCTCRALGRHFEIGQSACLRTPQGHRLATCGMVLNNTAWQFSETPCVSSRLRSTPVRIGRPDA